MQELKVSSEDRACKTNKRKYCFTLHIVERWISLPQHVARNIKEQCRFKNDWTKSLRKILSRIIKCKSPTSALRATNHWKLGERCGEVPLLTRFALTLSLHTFYQSLPEARSWARQTYDLVQ